MRKTRSATSQDSKGTYEHLEADKHAWPDEHGSAYYNCGAVESPTSAVPGIHGDCPCKQESCHKR